MTCHNKKIPGFVLLCPGFREGMLKTGCFPENPGVYQKTREFTGKSRSLPENPGVLEVTEQLATAESPPHPNHPLYDSAAVL